MKKCRLQCAATFKSCLPKFGGVFLCPANIYLFRNNLGNDFSRCVFFVVQRVDEEEVGEEAGADVAAQEVAAEDEAQAAAAAEAAKAKSTTAAGGGKNDPA